MTVDGTDCRISQPWPYYQSNNRKWYSHKFHKAGVRYELGICIETGWICWYYGPIPAGTPDITIFRMKLKTLLEAWESVIGDKGYRGDEQCITYYDATTEEFEEMLGNCLARHETVNRRLKEFKCLAGRFRNDIHKHVLCFEAAVAIVQLEIENGEPPYQVKEYYDPLNLDD